MPRSTSEGKIWTQARVLDLNPATILDIGPGAGTYSELLRPRMPHTHFTCVEIFEPYVEKYQLREKYPEVNVADARNFEFPVSDVVILGDVLEHMSREDAITVWKKAVVAARLATLLSIPIIEYPQGAMEGNEHEAHLHTWSHESVLRDFRGITLSWTGTEVGCYLAPGYVMGRK